ncbi:MAG: hypothetical protein ACOCVC_06575 [Spirochaeta sp.]
MLTRDIALADASARSEVFRRQGLMTLCRENADSVRGSLQKACTRVSEISPELSRQLYDRVHGRVVSKRTGLPRTQGFLFRGLKAIELSDPSYMNLTDTIEVATLLFELMAGREFPRIELKYRGARYVTEAGERLERARRALRAAVNRRNSRLWSIGEHMRGRRSMKRFAAAVHAIHTPGAWIDEIEASIEELMRSISKRSDNKEQHFARRTLQKLRDLDKAEQQLRRLEQELVKAQLGYKAARERMDRKYGTGTVPVILREGQRLRRRDHVGIELVSSDIALNKKEQRELSVALAPIVEQVESAAHDPAELVGIGYALMQVLEQHLPIHRWSVQAALERSNAPDLSQLEQGLTSSTRIGWGLSLVRELQLNHSEIIHAVARTLVDYHRIELDTEAIEYLVDEYGANKVYLEALAPSSDEDSLHSPSTSARTLKEVSVKLQQALNKHAKPDKSEKPRGRPGIGHRWSST